MSDVKLESCPFCGGKASPNGVIRRSKSPDLRWLDGTECLEAFYCNCIYCGVSNGGMAGGYQTREEALAAWNTRPAPALTPKQAAADVMAKALEEMLREKADYMRRNHLGNPEHETVSQQATAALAAYNALAKAGQP